MISDEVYRSFCYDAPFASPASWNEDVLVVDGFSKAHGMTGWRMGFAHGPSRLIQEMAKLQQFTFVCAPARSSTPASRPSTRICRRRLKPIAASATWSLPRSAMISSYPSPRVPSTPSPAHPGARPANLSAEAIRHNLLIIPGNVFSRRDTHFRISYAVDDATLERGLDVLRELAQSPAPIEASR